MTIQYNDVRATPTDSSEPRTSIFDELESNVRSYCRSFPVTFGSAKGSYVFGADGRPYLDFLAGAGALNYGHNHETMKSALLEYIAADGMTHGLDLHTSAKERFLTELSSRLLAPLGLDYKVQFTGPTGTNAVEAALKVARKATGRSGIFAFMGGYHGHSLGSLAATSNRAHRAGAGTRLNDVTFLPFPQGPMAEIDTLGYLRTILLDTHSGIELPAAVIVETVQAEGGIAVAPDEWMGQLRTICDDHDIVLIVDDIQTGCGRTGPFFSFERAGIQPDIVTLSKSISGYGLPMSLVLIRPDLDVWEPGEHTGTFRGNQLAFVTGAAALGVFQDEEIEKRTHRNSLEVSEFLSEECRRLDERLDVRGVGMIWGLDTAAIGPDGILAAEVSRRCFENGLIVERAGRHDTVLKLLPPLTISSDELAAGLQILAGALRGALLSS
jgi:diaminobutyrate-2-oxoglutarate transaminase